MTEKPSICGPVYFMAQRDNHNQLVREDPWDVVAVHDDGNFSIKRRKNGRVEKILPHAWGTLVKDTLPERHPEPTPEIRTYVVEDNGDVTEVPPYIPPYRNEDTKEE